MSRVDKFLKIPWFAEGLAFTGMLVFAIQLSFNAHFQSSVMDEGLYLVKGLLFAGGHYQPFQDYGPLSNQMPLAFLIPGVVQVLFGPGLRAGRIFAVLLGILMILGLWLSSRRLSNRWLAAGAVWALALTPAAARMYSMAISEGLIACLLIWVMALTLGEKRPLWQLILGAILAGVILMIRINMLPLLPLLCLYILWQNGWKTTIWVTLACALTVIVGHVFFWPNILRLWAYWLPESIVPFLKNWFPPSAPPLWDPAVTLEERLSSFGEALRYFFLPMVGALASWIFWPRKTAWKSPAHYRIAVYLLVLFASLITLHIWASLGQSYCVFCYPIYTSFYASLGLLLVVLTVASWQTSLSRWRQAASSLSIFIILTGICFNLIPASMIYQAMRLPVPRMRSLKFISGSAELWRVISNKTLLEMHPLFDIFSLIVPVLVGLVLGGALFLLAWLLPRLIKQTSLVSSTTARALLLLVLIGGVLTPTIWLGNGYHRYDCSVDVIAAYEQAGKTLQEIIPAQAKIFWRGSSPANLLYLPQAEIYPAQLNGDYSYRMSGDSDELLRYGWWNKSLGRKWAKEADYILVVPKHYEDWLKVMLESGAYQEITPYKSGAAESTAACLSGVFPRVFQRIP